MLCTGRVGLYNGKSPLSKVRFQILCTTFDDSDKALDNAGHITVYADDIIYITYQSDNIIFKCFKTIITFIHITVLEIYHSVILYTYILVALNNE